MAAAPISCCEEHLEERDPVDDDVHSESPFRFASEFFDEEADLAPLTLALA